MDVGQCGCKGQRTCLICEPSGRPNVRDDLRFVGAVCWGCGEIKDWKADSECYLSTQFWRCLCCEQLETPPSGTLSLKCSSVRKWWKETVNMRYDDDQVQRSEELEKLFDQLLPINTDFGFLVIPQVLSNEEERELITEIDSEPWAISQSGRRKQDYGVTINFKKQKVKTEKFSGLPSFAEKFFVSKWTRKQGFPELIEALEGFEAVELCNLEYSSIRGSHIDPHIDDAWIWGSRLVTFNLLSSTILTFSPPNFPIDLFVFLPRRSVVVVSGASRFEWLHAIDRKHVWDRRVACTLRELSPLFLPGGEMENIGKKILDSARSFKGRAVNFI